MSTAGSEKTFESRNLSTRAPDSFIKILDEIISKNNIYNSRSDLIRDAWNEFKESPIRKLFDDNKYELLQARFKNKDVREITRYYNYAGILRIALTLYLHEHHLEEIN